jgi:hypothetical protein
MTRADLDNAILYIIAAAIAGAMMFGSCEAHAQTLPTGPSGERLTPHLILARLCTHEASMPLSIDGRYVQHRNHEALWGDDCYGIHVVLLRGAQRMRDANPRLTRAQSYVLFAIAYSHDRLLHPPEHDLNRWAMYLSPGTHQPSYWRGPWNPDAWHYVWLLTGGIVNMGLEDFEGPDALWTCEEPVHDWGGRIDHGHARAIGLIEVACDGNLANTFYARPGLR